MSRPVLVSTLGAAALLLSGVAGAPAATATAGTATPGVAASATAVADNATGTFYGITPRRLIDTRAVGTRQPLAKGSTTTLQLGGFAGIPTSGVSAVVVNLTAVGTTSQGYFTIYPNGTTRPTASSINFPSGWTGANMVTVPVSADGKLALYNYGGAAHAVVDVLGWYAKDDTVRATKGMGAQFLTTETDNPERRYDSRTDEAGEFYGGDFIQFEDTWATSAAASAVKSYVVNVTAVNATASGVLTLWQGGSTAKPTVSTVNYDKTAVAPNMAIVPAGLYSSLKTGFKLQNTGSGSVHVVVDLVGYYLTGQAEGLRFVPRATPKRLVDTRQPVGPATVLSGAFGTTPRTVDATSVTSVDDSYFVIANTTGIKPTTRTYVTVWSGAGTRPSASNLNVNPGLVRSASTYAPLRYVLGPPQKLTFGVYNNAGSMHLAIDVAGTFDYYPSTGATTATGTNTAARVEGTATTARPDAPSVDRDSSVRSVVRR